MASASRTFGSPVPLSGRLRSELADARSFLRATARRSGSAIVVLAVGALDASNENAWKNLLREAALRASAPGPVVIDARELAITGCHGFAALAAEVERSRRRGISMCLVSQQSSVARIVAECGLRNVLPIHPTVESALSRTGIALSGSRFRER